MAVPVAMVIVLFLSVLITAAFMLSRSQFSHTGLAKDRLVSTYASETGYNMAMARIISQGWDDLWYGARHWGEIQGQISGGEYYVHLEDVENPHDGTLQCIDIYSKGTIGKTAYLHYQQVVLIPAPTFDRSEPSEVKDVKVFNRFKITSGNLDTRVNKVDLSSSEQRQKIKQVVAENVERIISSHNNQENQQDEELQDGISTRSSEDMAEEIKERLSSVPDDDSAPDEEDKAEYVASRGRKMAARDKVKLQVGDRGPVLSNEETSRVLFGENLDGKGMIRGSTVAGQNRTQLIEKASIARVYLDAFINGEAANYSARVQVHVPIYVNYENQWGQQVTVTLDEWLKGLSNSLDVAPGTVGSGDPADAELRDSLVDSSTEFEVEGNSDCSVMAYRISGYELGASQNITANIGQVGQQRLADPSWVTQSNSYQAQVENNTVSIPAPALRETQGTVAEATDVVFTDDSGSSGGSGDTGSSGDSGSGDTGGTTSTGTIGSGTTDYSGTGSTGDTGSTGGSGGVDTTAATGSTDGTDSTGSTGGGSVDTTAADGGTDATGGTDTTGGTGTDTGTISGPSIHPGRPEEDTPVHPIDPGGSDDPGGTATTGTGTTGTTGTATGTGTISGPIGDPGDPGDPSIPGGLADPGDPADPADPGDPGNPGDTGGSGRPGGGSGEPDEHDTPGGGGNGGDPDGPGCFAAATPVWTPGGFKPIGMIRPGDKVYSMNEATGRIEVSVVTSTFSVTRRGLVRVTGGEDTMVCSRNHRFHTESGRWMKIENVNEQVTTATGTLRLQVKSLDITMKVYNFEVDRTHTYFVGESKLLVHNVKPGDYEVQ